MDNIVSVKLDSRYASTLGVWQYNYGQVLRITGPGLPPAVEVQFSLDEKSGETLSRVGTTVDGVTEVKIPDELLTHSATSNYRIYAYIYLTDETSGNTKYEITIPVRARSKPTSPTEDPETDPDLFRETVVAVNASAERAENAANSATESAASAEETLIEIKRVADGISEDIENANTAKSELSDTINSAEEKKKELAASTEEAGEIKTELDSSISSAGEKQLALDATVERANTADASLKEQIGSAEQIQANVEQIAKNKTDISSLNEDLAEVQDKKITKFYASNQGETHLTDSDNGKMQDMILYGRSEQKIYSGYQLIDTSNPVDGKQKTTNGITFTVQDDGGIKIVGTSTDDAYFNFNLSKNKLKLKDNCSLIVSANELYSKRNINFQNDIYVDDAYAITLQQPGSENIAKTFSGSVAIGNSRIVVPRKTTVDVIYYPMIEYGNTTHDFEPYTGGIPSPSPDYPQEIVSVGDSGSIEVNVRGKNLVDIYGYSAVGITNPEEERKLFNGYGTTLSTTEKTDKLIVNQEIVDGATADSYTSGYFCVGINPKLEDGKDYIITFKINVIQNPFHVSDIVVMFNGMDAYMAQVVGDKVTVKAKYNEFNERQYVEFRIRGMSLEFSNFMITEVGETDDYEPYHEQTVQLPYTLNAIPVASGGNVTIDGQQYIADYVDVERGKVVRMCERETVNTKNGNINEEYRLAIDLGSIAYNDGGRECIFSTFKWTSWETCAVGTMLYIKNIKKPNNELYTAQELKELSLDFDVIYQLLEQQEIDLTTEQAQALKALVTNYPVTNISVTSDQLDGYTVFNYPISMANGWNYVKQQLNDNRDYIYDMDTKTQDIDIQSAEAYVNSEYAVALTELEV